MIRVVLVGEDNPYSGADPRYALFHLPRGAAGDRLREHLGLRDATYAALARVNLCDRKWSAPAARARAATMLQRYDVVVACGAKVVTAFCQVTGWARPPFFGSVYPEVGGWDLVLVCSEPRRLDRINVVAPGEQVGVHAKLRANCDVLAQALPPPADGIGYRYPTFPLVAVPNAGFGFEHIARHLGLGLVEAECSARQGRWMDEFERRKVEPRVRWWPRRHDHKLLDLPPIASRTIFAGAPSPRQLSDWRVRALRFLAAVRPTGSFRVSDLARHGINKSWADRWGDAVDWATEVRKGKTVRVRVYQLVDRQGNLPDWGYRDVAAELWKHDADVAASRRDTPG